MSENYDNSNESNNLGSDLIQQTSRQTALLRTGVLRPSVLSTNSSIKSVAEPSDKEAPELKVDDTTNPFKIFKEQLTDDEAGGAAGGGILKQKSDPPAIVSKPKATEEEEFDERPDPLKLLRKNGLERSNLFAATKHSIPRVENSGFVFGQNVHERVTGEKSKLDSASDSESASAELLFSNVIQNAVKSSENDAVVTKETKSLTDVAREYEESRAQKRKFEEVVTFTGEENEVNIVDINCKLFAFVNSNWEERGRGSLRLNDSKDERECSRVVFRTFGNLRLLLNTKVWAGMIAERSSQKSLRLTAMDSTGKIKIFLLMARPLEINQLYRALLERIETRKASYPHESLAVEVVKSVEANSSDTDVVHNEVCGASSGVEEDENTADPKPKKILVTPKENN